MPVFLAALGGMLINLVGSLAGRLLVALGVSVATYTGLSVTTSWIKSSALSYLTALPPDLLGILAYLKIGVVINIITSAITARMVIDGLNGGTFKKWVLK